MKNRFFSGYVRLLALFTILLAIPSFAAEFHVTSTDEFSNALSTSETNGQTNTIYLAAGTYRGRFQFDPGHSNPITIRGEPGTTPNDVILDGEGAGIVLSLTGFSGGITVTISGVTVQNGASGGMVLFFGDLKLHLILENVIVQNNSNTTHGGGVKVRTMGGNAQVQLEIWNSIIRNNQSETRGGGIYVNTIDGNNTLDLLIVNSLIYRNQANWAGGGIDLLASEVGENNVTRAMIINSTISENTAGDLGGGIEAYGSDGNGAAVLLDLYNTILSGNKVGGSEDQDLHIDKKNPANVAVNAYNCLINGLTGDLSLYHPSNVINENPLFVVTANDNYRLSPESPCIDAGTAAVPSPPGLPETDLEGNTRVAGPLPDIGAYEFIGLNIKPDEGTIGTIVDIMGSEFGPKKGKVWLGQVVLKVMKWTTGWIQASLTKPLASGVYDVTIEPKGVEAMVLEDAFTVMGPEIDSVDPANGSPNDEIILRGRFFGTKRGKVTLGGENCKVSTWTMDPATGASEIHFVVPKGLSAGTHELNVTNGVGSDTINLIVDNSGISSK